MKTPDVSAADVWLFCFLHPLDLLSLSPQSLLDDARGDLTKPSPERCPSSCLYGVLWLTETPQAHPDVSPAFLGTSLVKCRVEPSKIEPLGAVYCQVVVVVKAASPSQGYFDVLSAEQP